jgi:hypothetical protein
MGSSDVGEAGGSGTPKTGAIVVAQAWRLADVALADDGGIHGHSDGGVAAPIACVHSIQTGRRSHPPSKTSWLAASSFVQSATPHCHAAPMSPVTRCATARANKAHNKYPTTTVPPGQTCVGISYTLVVDFRSLSLEGQ